MTQVSLLAIQRSCVFSPDRLYRYRLDIRWSEGGKGTVAWCMLNPSKADEVINDPTVERRQRWSQMQGFDGMVVVNAFAYRATDPDDMLAQADPVGPDNDQHILAVAREADLFVAGWGNHGDHLNRGRKVLAMLREQGVEVFCLGINGKGGQPKHPLYIGYAQPLIKLP